MEMSGELSTSTQSGRKIAGAVSSRAPCSPTAAAPPLSEAEADDAESSEARRVAMMVRHFRCLQGKKARQTAQTAVQIGKMKRKRGGEGAGRRIRQRPTRLARPRVDAHIGIRPSSRKFGSRKGRIRAASLLGSRIAPGDHVRPTTSRGLNSGGRAARPVRGEGRER
jgi:hypothetical protein